MPTASAVGGEDDPPPAALRAGARRCRSASGQPVERGSVPAGARGDVPGAEVRGDRVQRMPSGGTNGGTSATRRTLGPASMRVVWQCSILTAGTTRPDQGTFGLPDQPGARG